MAAPPPTLRPQPTLPGKEFSNIRYYAEGGMSWVYLAYNKDLERDEIIKLLKPGKSSAQREEFKREGRTLAQFNQANICQVFSVGECPEGPYVRMEFIQGPTLQEWMEGGEQRDQPLPALRDILRVLTDLAKALDFAHSKKVVHSDLKPENVLLPLDPVQKTRFPKLIDFGIARRIDSEADLMGQAKERIAGTLPYMAPEQLRGEGASPSTDLYSLGVMFYELLTGQLPFHGDRDTVIQGHLRGPIPRLPKHLINFQPVLERALAKSPSVRFKRGDDFIRRANDAVSKSPELAALLDMSPLDPDAPRPGPDVPARGRTKTHTHTLPAQELRLAEVNRLVSELQEVKGSLITNPKSFELMRQLAELATGLQTRLDAELVRSAVENAQSALQGRLDLSHIAEELTRQIARTEAVEALRSAKEAAFRGNWLPPEQGNALELAR
ncbi:MAG: serine/threonine protein kinase, partial [Xanthomonadales bacterium]|nr:serine/threonine protein kinase [Xanthomonadales bacterium]